MESLCARLMGNLATLKSEKMLPTEESWKDKMVKPLFSELLGAEFHCEAYALLLFVVCVFILTGFLRENYLYLMNSNEYYKSDMAVAQR